MSSYIYLNHQNKGKAYNSALHNAGWKQIGEEGDADIALVDSDVTPYRLVKLEKFAERGIKIFKYPHSARPPFFYDYPGYKPFEKVTARFVSAPGHKLVMSLMGLDTSNVHVMGWSYCSIRPFSRPRQLRNIVFAPLHANGNGWLSEDDKQMNRDVQERLARTARVNHLDLIVRYLGQLSLCGLERMPGVTYVHGEPKPESTLWHIDNADLIVGTETFAYMAVARGKPTLMMGEGRAPRFGNCEETFRYVQNWDSYKGLVMYPLDILSSDDTWALMEEASNEGRGVREWKARMIGEPFRKETFMDCIQNYLKS